MEGDNLKSCKVCGKTAEKVYKVNLDGAIIEIAYCKRCLRDLLLNKTEPLKTQAVETLVNHIEYIQDCAGNLGVFKNDNIKMFAEQPSVMHITLFDIDKENIIKIYDDIKRRKLFLLNSKLRKAVKREDYKRAKQLKSLIDELNGVRRGKNV